MPDNMKPKHLFSNRVLINAWGCALALIMLGAGITLGLAGAIIFGPGLLGYDATATALADRAVQLGATEADFVQRGRDTDALLTQIARDASATSAFLSNNQVLLQQTATQIARDVQATQTSQAVQSAQQRTQIALEATSTQAQLQRQATESALQFQQTRAALGDDVTLASGQMVTQQAVPITAPATVTALPSSTPTRAATTTPTYLLPPSDTPSPTSSALLLDESFTQGVSSDVWQSAMNADWFAGTQQGVQATRDGAWLLSEARFGGDYQLQVELLPRLWQQESYWLLFGVTDERGYAVAFDVQERTLQRVTLYQFDPPLLTRNTPLSAETALQLETTEAAVPFNEDGVALHIGLRGGLLSVMLDETLLLETALPIAPGQVGLQVPAGTDLNALRVERVTR